ncbi:hypothetical protein BIW11_04912 [Tropilaelaps mercedesae]|uniref:Uncharacterized protein n=1 Tax=Tropilaelaps mercedesae TaxID=418985 RepID=A0A1V9X046_9ACAR|nr:hypothetical protein BIW11_04912 [Tropilaelaps mercedesae]
MPLDFDEALGRSPQQRSSKPGQSHNTNKLLNQRNETTARQRPSTELSFGRFGLKENYKERTFHRQLLLGHQMKMSKPPNSERHEMLSIKEDNMERPTDRIETTGEVNTAGQHYLEPVIRKAPVVPQVNTHGRFTDCRDAMVIGDFKQIVCKDNFIENQYVNMFVRDTDNPSHFERFMNLRGKFDAKKMFDANP